VAGELLQEQGYLKLVTNAGFSQPYGVNNETWVIEVVISGFPPWLLNNARARCPQAVEFSNLPSLVDIEIVDLRQHWHKRLGHAN